jgi:signal transduction histidine kinase
LMAKGAALGTLCLGLRQSREFSPAEVAFLSAIGNQIAIAVENARLYEELSRKEQLRGELLHRLIFVQEEERIRIARELHDETSQTLTALLYALDTVTENCQNAQVPPPIAKMRTLTLSAIDGVHKTIFDLRPTMLDQLGLVAALRWYAETHLADRGALVEITEAGSVRRLPTTIETALFRAAQEAINNVSRHAGARHLQVSIDFSPDRVEICVTDDGIGFDLHQVTVVPGSSSGLGLLSMQERMSAVGGEFVLNSAPGQGTVLTLRAPIPGDGHESDSRPRRG